MGPRSEGTAARRLVVAAVGWALVAAGCGPARAPLPLRPEPVPYADTLPIPEPERRPAHEAARLFQVATGDQLVRPFDVRRWTGRRHEALNVTHFDRVVPSAWWVPRNVREPMTPAEVARGPAATPPDTSATLTVVAGKSAGIQPGFTVEDARGHRYLFKFDPRGHLHLASSADVISSRLLHAAGYHVPEEYKVAFDSARLRVSPEATITTEEARRRMRPEDVRDILERTQPREDGRWVALASRFVPGEPKGPFLFSGVRGDDPNDHYQHQHRRELRGLYVVAAWLNHVDMRFANTLDVFVEPGYLRHYLIDLAATLGSGTVRPHRPREGREYNFDLWPSLARLLTLGFFRMGWEGRDPGSIHPSIGWMPVEEFDPAGWKANWPNEAFEAMTARDAYWGAKIVGSFTDRQIRAAVDAGGLPRRAAADTLADILIHRRDRTVAHWYARVTPVEHVEVEPSAGAAGGGTSGSAPSGPGSASVVFVDLGLRRGIWTGAETEYRWRFEHPALARRETGRTAGREEGPQRIRVPLSPPPDPESDLAPADRIARFTVTAVRPGAAERPAVVYLRWRGPGRGYRAAGLEH